MVGMVPEVATPSCSRVELSRLSMLEMEDRLSVVGDEVTATELVRASMEEAVRPNEAATAETGREEGRERGREGGREEGREGGREGGME